MCVFLSLSRNIFKNTNLAPLREVHRQNLCLGTFYVQTFSCISMYIQGMKKKIEFLTTKVVWMYFDQFDE